MVGSSKFYYLIVFIISLIFLVLTFFGIFLFSDFVTLIVILIQIFLLANLLWLSWKEYKAEGEKIELEIEKKKK
jgi:hypothetical protein